MTGRDVFHLRTAAGWTQERAAARLRVSQAYLSMVERGKRAVSKELTAEVLRVFHGPATLLPLNEPGRSLWTTSRLQEELGALGYPGYAYLRKKPRLNPAELLLAALGSSDLDARVTEALPWLPFTYPEMDWEWLGSHAKLANLQNRLAYVVLLAAEKAHMQGFLPLHAQLNLRLQALESSRLASEDTLCRESMTRSERTWLRTHRPGPAAHWNLLTDLTADQLSHV